MNKINNEAIMGLIWTFIRLGIVSNYPLDFPTFLVWFKDVKRYSETYGFRD